MSDKFKYNIRTFGGQKQILNALEQSLSNIKNNNVKGLKSVSYHKKKIQELKEGLERQDKDALKKAIKYTLRGGEHAKPVDIRKDSRGVEYFYGTALNNSFRNSPSTQINTFKDFVNNWDIIKDILDGFGGRTLNSALFGAGYGYEQLRDRLASSLGMSVGELLQFLEQAKDLYYWEYDEIKNAYYNSAGNPIFGEQLLNKYYWWGITDLDDLQDVNFEGRKVGADVVRILKW